MTAPHIPPVDLPPRESFPSIALQEAALIEREEEKIALIDRAIRLADNLLLMAGGEGYRRFVESIDEIKQANYAKLLKAKTDRDATLLIGACQALDDILELMTSTADNRARLAAARKQKEDALAKFRNPATRDPL